MSDAFQVEAVLEAVLSKLRSLAESGQTFGQPITLGEITIIPYMAVHFGLGGGGGGAPKRLSFRQADGLWGGAGGGVKLQPLGFLVIRGSSVEVLPIDSEPSQWEHLLSGMLPTLQQWLQAQIKPQDEHPDDT